MVAAATLGNDLNRTSAITIILLAMLPYSSRAELNAVLIEGLAGESRYGEQFGEQVTAIDAALKTLTDDDRIRIFRGKEADRETILIYFETLASTIDKDDQLALFLIGHGSFDDHEYKFNIPGPDLTGEDLQNILNEMPNVDQLLVNTSSASGATAEKLQQEDRMLILATRSGVERHATRFGVFFAAALSNTAADIDKNRIVTALEAYNFAKRQVEDFFERNGRLATEHPRADGDRLGRFSLARLEPARIAAADDILGKLIADRDALNARVDGLRLSRDRMSLDDYQAQLLPMMLELAELEDAIEAREREIGARE